MALSLGAARYMGVLHANDRALLDLILTTMVELGPDQVRDVSIVIDRWEKFPQARLGEQAAELSLTGKQFQRLSQILQRW